MDYTNFNHRIWLVGRNGRVGKALESSINTNNNLQIISTDIEDVDITDLLSVERFVDSIRPDTIINCVSKRDKKWCEDNPKEAFKINSLGARNLAIASNSRGIHLIHISTDYVFDGENEKAYREYDVVNPISLYAKTMAYAEKLIKDHSKKFTIFRCSRLYGKRIINSILEQSKSGKVYYLKDKISNPITTLTLSEIVLKFIGSEQYGIFHIGSKDTCSYKEWTEELLKYFNIEAELIEKDNNKNDYYIPDHLVLDTFMLDMIGFDEKPLWKNELIRFIKERQVKYEK